MKKPSMGFLISLGVIVTICLFSYMICINMANYIILNNYFASLPKNSKDYIVNIDKICQEREEAKKNKAQNMLKSTEER